MNLKEKINSDIKDAMLTKNNGKLIALRGLKSAITLAQTEKNVTAELDDNAILNIIQKQIKTRKESSEIYKKENRDDLYSIEINEIEVLEEYLPKQLSIEEVTLEVQSIINETGATTIKDMGKVMGIATKKLAGKIDNKTISDIIKGLLI